jgi:hypothetical protein
MIGVPNEGSADAFATLVDGYSITEGLRRRVPLLNKLTAEDAVRTPSVFQLLPHEGTARFLDENLDVMRLDLYDPAVWKKYAWTPIFSDSFRRRSSNHRDAATDSQPVEDGNLDEYLAATLRRTRQFHRSLDAGINLNQPVTLLAIGGDCEETLNAPVIIRDPKENRWLTLIRPREFSNASGTKLSKQRVTEAMYAPGDGRVTRKSLLGETTLNVAGQATEVRLALTYAVFGCDLHGQLQRNKTLQDNALTALVGEAMK